MKQDSPPKRRTGRRFWLSVLAISLGVLGSASFSSGAIRSVCSILSRRRVSSWSSSWALL